MQTAVLDSPDSDHPLSLPTDRKEADWYLSRYRGKAFYCGLWLGGCGWRLTAKLYRDRVCHFAHLPAPEGMAPACERRGGIESADHLFIHRGLTSRMGEQQRFDGRMDKERCTDLLVRRRRSRSAVKVQFVNLTPAEWAEQDELLHAQFEHVNWMVGPTASRTGRHLLERDGYALHVRCAKGRNGVRAVMVGTETRDGDLEWSSLDDCEFTDKGLVTPLLRNTRTGGRATTPPGFPLAVKDVVVRPQEPVTRPDVLPHSHVAAIEVVVGEREPLKARLALPGHDVFVVGEPYALVEPASVDAAGVKGHPVPTWTIFSAGVTPLNPPESEADKAPAPDELIRHRLTTLIAELRKARNAGRHDEVLAMLDAHRALLSELTRREFRSERAKVIEVDRWAHARTQAHQPSPAPAARRETTRALGGDPPVRVSMDAVRHELALLLAQLRGARTKGDHRRISQLLDAHAALTESAAADPALRKLTKEIETFRRSPPSDRLQEIIDELHEAKCGDRVERVRALMREGTHLVMRLGDAIGPEQRQELVDSGQWLAEAAERGTGER
ncbi:hypothetical protein [Nonomuraea sp. NPDC001699]